MFDAGVSGQLSGSDIGKLADNGADNIPPPVTPIASQPASSVMLNPTPPLGDPTKTTTPSQQVSDLVVPATQEETPPAEPPVLPATKPVEATAASGVEPGGDSRLIGLKQKALGELSPLVDKLDQLPQERFRTIMMLCQATDDSSLVDKAYEAARAISDEKERAQALLDVVNEINYFTQPKDPAKSAPN